MFSWLWSFEQMLLSSVDLLYRFAFAVTTLTCRARHSLLCPARLCCLPQRSFGLTGGSTGLCREPWSLALVRRCRI